VATTRDVVRTVPDEGADPLATMRALGQHWGPRADFVWWGEFGEITVGSTDFGRLILLQYLEYIDDGGEDRSVEGDEVDDLLRFLRALEAQRAGLFLIESCSLERLGAATEAPRPDTNLRAECALAWITVPGPRPGPSAR